MKTLPIIMLLMFIACKESSRSKALTQQQIDERLIEVNKQLLMNEDAAIDAFVEDHEWPVISTGSGLRYWIYEEGHGPLAEIGQVAAVEFVVNLLDGTECYKTDEGVPGTFGIEQSSVESGLHEAIQFMRIGDKAKIILPAHRAHGLAGDLKKIPPHSTIIYDLHLVALR